MQNQRKIRKQPSFMPPNVPRFAREGKSPQPPLFPVRDAHLAQFTQKPHHTRPDSPGQNERMSTVAVIDIGSNSVCLLVARRGDDGVVTIIDKLKDTPRLRDEIGADGMLSETGSARTLAALRLFAQVIHQHGARTRVVATAALRAAVNGQDFIDRAQREAGLRVEIVTGDEEARLAFLGALSGLGRLDGETLCADIGGGSTELVLGLNGVAMETVSKPLGALTITRAWLSPDPLTPRALEQARTAVRATLEPELAMFRGRQLHAVATSGTIQRVARIACMARGEMRSDVHGLTLSADALRQTVAQMANAPTLLDRLRIPGMDPSRADILLGGALIYEALTDLLDLPEWTVSMAGLRMGVIHELLDPRQKA